MDRLIRRFDAQADNDLMLCEHRGVAYQRDMTKGRIEYGASYFETFKSYAGSPVERALNAGRCALVARHARAGATILDVGVGSGAFVHHAAAEGFDAKGFDVNPVAVAWLKSEGFFAEDATGFEAITFWDSLEHIDDPGLTLRRLHKGALAFVAIPIVGDLRRIRESKHYKPGEHLYYWTPQGFVDWMALHGFRLLEASSHETDAGRESIGAFAFCRDLPDYHDHLKAYSEMHSTRHYGSSATELHLETAASVVRKISPGSILDFGCGRSDLVAHFWRDGSRKIARYDPAIPAFKATPAGRFDLVLVCDVMEHIPMASVDRILGEVHARGDRAFFTISTKLARAKLPDGRNAHVTLLTKSEWSRWIASEFGCVIEMPSSIEHELVLLALPKGEQRRMAA